MLDRFIDVLRAFEGGKLAEKADHLGAILSDLLDFERADHMAEECGGYFQPPEQAAF